MLYPMKAPVSPHRRMRSVALVITAAALVTIRFSAPFSPAVVAAPADGMADDPPIFDRNAFLQAEQQAGSTPDGTILGVTSASVGRVESTSINGLAPFPHIAYYGGPNSSGWPFVGSTEKLGTCSNNPAVACAVNTDCGSPSITCNNPAQRPAIDAPLNAAELDLYAKFPQIIVSPTPLSDGRPDIIPAIRARNPNISIFAYVVGHVMWCPGYPGNNSYPDGYFYRDYWLGVTGGDQNCSTTSNRLLWNQDGTRSGYDVNLAYREALPGGGYRYPVAEGIAEAIYEHAKLSRNFDGIFIDIFCPNYLWAENPANPWDYARAGYGADNSDPANRAAFTDGWAAGHQREADRLRELAIADGQPDFPIAGNCGQTPSSLFPVMNGWMRENYPFQNGGTFFTNMLTWPWGYLHQDRNFRTPQYNYIFTGADPSSQPYTPLNQQKLRFGLGSAALGNGYHIFEDASGYLDVADYPTWWFDEYGVDTTVQQDNPEWGKAKNGLAYTGWLGQPTGDFYNMILPNANPDLLPVNDFEQDITHIDMRAFSPAQATAERSTIGAGAGSGSLHINISQVGSNSSSVLFNSDTFQTTNGEYYSVTFWAKSSQNRAVTVYVDGAGQSLPISTTWRRYQISVKATSTGNAVYQFQIGHETGDIWFDDIRVQAGIGNVFRRDFDRGSVLLNPYNLPMTIQLEKPFRKIRGTVNPTLNDGSIVTSVTLTPDVGYGIGDAIFLLNVDVTPPATITDLKTTAGAYVLSTGKKRVTIRPFGGGYRGNMVAKRVKFRSPPATWYLFANTDRSSNGAIMVYNASGKLVKTLKPADVGAASGVTMSVAAQPSTRSVYIAAVDVAKNSKVRVFQLTSRTVRRLHDVTIKGASSRRTTRAAFLKLYTYDYGLVTMVNGRPSTLSAWRYNPAKKKFVKDATYDVKRIDTRNGRFRLKS